MYRSASYAGQGSKSVFVEMAEQSAESARRLREAGLAQPERPAVEVRSLVCRAASRWHQMLRWLGKRTTEEWADVRGQMA
jgi:hypothetical protein